MKKLVVLVGLVFLVGACGTLNVPVQKPAQLPVQEVKLTIQGAENVQVSKDGVSRVMEVPYDEPKLEQMVLIGDTAYGKIWGTITSFETMHMWNDLNVLRYKGIRKVKIIVNSGGGWEKDGLAVADLLIEAIKEGFEITTEARGMVASAAIPIFLVGKKRIANKGCQFMVHEGKLFKFIADETKYDLAAQQRMIEIGEQRYNEILLNNSNLTEEQAKAMIRKTTWFTAEEAQKMGMVDEVK